MKQSVVKEQMKKGAISLLTKKNFIDITVTDLVKESGVARASFYRVYKNVGEIIDEIARELVENFKKDIYQTVLDGNFEEIKRKSLSFFTSFKDGNRPITKILPENSYLIVSKISEVALFDKDFFKDLSHEARYMVILIIINATALARIWEKDGFRETPEHINQLLYDVIGKKVLEYF